MQGNGHANERWREDSGTSPLAHRRGDRLATGQGGNPPLAKVMARPPLPGGGDDMMPAAGALGGEDRACRELVLDRGAYAQPPPPTTRSDCRQGGSLSRGQERASGDRRRARSSGAGRSLLVPWCSSLDPVTRRRVAHGSGLSPHGDAASVIGCRRGDKPHQYCVVIASPGPICGTTLCPTPSRLARLGVRARPQGESPRGGPMTASACASQNVMPISRYIVVAMVRWSRACSRWPVRR